MPRAGRVSLFLWLMLFLSGRAGAFAKAASGSLYTDSLMFEGRYIQTAKPFSCAE